MEKIFKYVPIDNNSINAIEKKYLWFSKPVFFNDPFDCNMNMISQYEVFQEELDKINPILKETIIQNTKDFGICCFSKRNDNLHLWSLYSQNHTGICLIYDKTKFDGYYSNLLNCNCELLDINYVDSPLDLNENIEFENFDDNSSFLKPIRRIFDDPRDLDKLMEKLLLQKNKSIWKNEEEMRFILAGLALKNSAKKYEDDNKNGYRMPLPENSLIGVICGNRTNPENIEKIRSIVDDTYPRNFIYEKIELNYKDWTVEIKSA